MTVGGGGRSGGLRACRCAEGQLGGELEQRVEGGDGCKNGVVGSLSLCVYIGQFASANPSYNPAICVSRLIPPTLNEKA